MERFHPNAWRYGTREPAATLSQLPKPLQPMRPSAQIARELFMSGGKTLGLRLCETLAKGSDRLRVPPWIAVSASELGGVPSSGTAGWIASRLAALKVRSSTYYEDWLSGASGEQRSRTVRDAGRVWDHAREISVGRHPVLLQEYAEGIGLVVDIAHSDVLCRPVVRISTGRELVENGGARRFTSATHDPEGIHLLLDPVSGARLGVPGAGRILSDSPARLPLRELAQELWRRFEHSGMNFGVQMEVVIHPRTPSIWWLVQIRPSPNRVRCGQPVEALTDPMLTTPAVSRAFAAQGDARLTTERDLQWLLLASTMGETQADATVGTWARNEILVWHRRGDADWNAWMLLAAMRAGVRAQITRGATVVNTTHGGREVTNKEDIAVTEGEAGILAVPQRWHDKIVRQLRAGPRPMAAVSDGLVGQLALT